MSLDSNKTASDKIGAIHTMILKIIPQRALLDECNFSVVGTIRFIDRTLEVTSPTFGFEYNTVSTS